MKRSRIMRACALLSAGAMMLQATGCTINVFDIIQTGLLGITAAGSFAILQNI